MAHFMLAYAWQPLMPLARALGEEIVIPTAGRVCYIDRDAEGGQGRDQTANA